MNEETTLHVVDYQLTRMTPDEFFEAIFTGCKNQNLIGIGSIRPGRNKPVPFLHYLTPVAVEDRGTTVMKVVEASKPASTFFCYNTYSPAACGITKGGGKIEWKGPGTEVYFSAKKEQIEELCAVVVDLDVGRPIGSTSKPGATLTLDEALQIVLERGRERRVPVPSLVVFSGRGLQLVYLLWNEIGDELTGEEVWVNHEKNGLRQPVPRTPKASQVWTQIADDIVKKRLGDIAPDTKASKTTCNWFRVPGTTNEKSGKEVVAWRVGENLRYYSLDELSAALLDTAAPEHHPLLFREPDDAYGATRSKRRKDEGEDGDDSRPRRASTPEQVAYPSVVRMKELEKINDHRRGMSEGHRHHFVYHYRSAVYRASYPANGHVEAKRIAWEKVTKIVATFDQPAEKPFTLEDVSAACRANPWQIAANVTVADDLDVMAEEVEGLDLTSIVPKEMAEIRALNVQNARQQKRVEREQRDLVVKVLLRADRSYTIIERQTGVKRSTIRNINQKFMETGELLASDSPLKNQEAYLVSQIEWRLLGVVKSPAA